MKNVFLGLLHVLLSTKHVRKKNHHEYYIIFSQNLKWGCYRRIEFRQCVLRTKDNEKIKSEIKFINFPKKNTC